MTLSVTSLWIKEFIHSVAILRTNVRLESGSTEDFLTRVDDTFVDWVNDSYAIRLHHDLTRFLLSALP